MLTLVSLPILTDNYIWLLHDGSSAIAVDPGEAEPLLHYLQLHGLRLQAVLCTHHHYDHVDGIPALRRAHPDLTVYGPATPRFAAWVTHPVVEGSQLPLLGQTFQVLETPAHTLDHVVYYAGPWLFAGDVLFACGCGRLFEGTPAQLQQSLQRLAALPAETLLCCTHEYTLSNQRFALAVEPDNLALQQRHARDAQRRAAGLSTLPSTLAEEGLTNPFLRCEQASVQRAVSQQAGAVLTDSLAVLVALRCWKDVF